MGKRHSFEIITLNISRKAKMLEKARYYLKKCFPFAKRVPFHKMYCTSESNMAKGMLQHSIYVIRNKKSCSEDDVIRELQEWSKMLESKKGNPDKRRRKMEFWEIVIIAFIVIIAAALAVVLVMKRNQTNAISYQRGEIKPIKRITYTQEDRDMMELIHELSDVYQKTDDYMKK